MCFFEKALEFIFLPSCGVCGKLGEGYLCNNCGKELEKYVICVKDKFDERELNSQLESKLGQRVQNDNFEKILYKDKQENKNKDTIYKFHIFRYEELTRDLIIQYKFNEKSYLYKTFCEFIVKNKKTLDFIKSYDIIIPVPIHKKRYRARGYNQSELISKELARRCQLKCYNDILIKKVNNNAQSTLNKNERLENVKNVYKIIKPEKINNKKVLIFDDIYTTGATVQACALELKKAHTKEIGILTLAKD